MAQDAGTGHVIDLLHLRGRDRDRVSIRRPRNRTGLETMTAHYVRHSFKPHAHDEYIIGIIERGGHAVWCRGEKHGVGGGTLVTMRPGDVHHGGPGVPDGWVQRMVYLNEDAVSELVGDALGRSVHGVLDFPAPFHRHPELASCFAQFHNVLHGSQLSLARDVALDAIMRLVFGTVSSVPNADGRRRFDGRIAETIAYLQEHTCDDVTIDDLCKVSGLRRRQTIEAFKRHVGLPPHAYHLVLKISAVKGMLRTGLSATEAAVQAGFADQSHMTRNFVAIVGTTPGLYAQA